MSFIENYGAHQRVRDESAGRTAHMLPGAGDPQRSACRLAGVAVNEIPLRPHVLFEEFRKAGLIDRERYRSEVEHNV